MNQLRRILDSVNETRGPTVSSELLPLVYQDLKSLAAHQMAHQPAGHTLQPTAPVKNRRS
jgi:hypothetical protein